MSGSFLLTGGGDTLSLGSDVDAITGSTGTDTLTFNGASTTANLNGSMTASIADVGNSLQLNIGSSTQTDTITGFGSDTHGGHRLSHPVAMPRDPPARVPAGSERVRGALPVPAIARLADGAFVIFAGRQPIGIFRLVDR